MRRELCPVETLYIAQRSRAVLSLRLRGRLDAAVLSDAFDSLTSANPSLRSRLSPGESGFALELLPEEERPRLLVRDEGAEAGLEQVYEEELNTPLPVGVALSRAVLARAAGSDRYLMMMVVDHAVTDGHSAIAVLNDLWDRYRALLGTDGEAAAVTGAAAGTDDAAAAAFPVPVSELLPACEAEETEAYFQRRLAETAGPPVALVPYDVPAPTDTAEEPAGAGPRHRIEVQRLLLDTAETEQVRRAARENGVSVHGLVAAAMLKAARARVEGEGAVRLGCLSPVDLRSRLDPPLDPRVMTAAVASHLQTPEVAPESDPLVLAKEVTDRLRESLDRGDHFQEMRIIPRVPQHPLLQLGSVIVTNMGASRGPVVPEGLEVEDVRLTPARENYFPQAGRSPVMACVVSFDGRLAVEFPHYTACFSRSFVQRLRDDVRGTLLASAAGGADAPVPAPVA